MKERKTIEKSVRKRISPKEEQAYLEDDKMALEVLPEKDAYRETDSLSLYIKQIRENQLLSPEDEIKIMSEYDSLIEAIWQELCNFSFVANEYLNILDGITVENICDKFMLLSAIAEKKTRPETFLSVFLKWRAEIAACQKKNIELFASNQTESKENRIVMHELLKRFRPQNFFIYEWLDVALEYEKLLREKDSNNTSHSNALKRILLSKQEFLAAMKRIAQLREKSENIRETILEANLRLVISIAKHFQNRGLSLGDLVQEGNIGLMKALDKFDYRLGHKFSTYASWWIKQSISKGLAEQSRTIRIPTHMIATISRMNSEEQRFIQENGREPEPEELAALLDMPKERVRALQKMASQTISLQAPAGENMESSLGDFIEDENAEDPIQRAAFSLLKEKIDQALDMLSERERQVISMRYGLVGGGPKTLVEISEYFGVTRERVRQIEVKALEKLRHPSRRKHLEGYF